MATKNLQQVSTCLLGRDDPNSQPPLGSVGIWEVQLHNFDMCRNCVQNCGFAFGVGINPKRSPSKYSHLYGHVCACRTFGGHQNLVGIHVQIGFPTEVHSHENSQKRHRRMVVSLLKGKPKGIHHTGATVKSGSYAALAVQADQILTERQKKQEAKAKIHPFLRNELESSCLGVFQGPW